MAERSLSPVNSVLCVCKTTHGLLLLQLHCAIELYPVAKRVCEGSMEKLGMKINTSCIAPRDQTLQKVWRGGEVS